MINENMIMINENIRKIATGQGDDYTTGCLLDYSYFKENYKMIAIDLSKQQALDADPRAIQQITFYWRSKKKLFKFSQGNVKVL